MKRVKDKKSTKRLSTLSSSANDTKVFGYLTKHAVPVKRSSEESSSSESSSDTEAAKPLYIKEIKKRRASSKSQVNSLSPISGQFNDARRAKKLAKKADIKRTLLSEIAEYDDDTSFIEKITSKSRRPQPPRWCINTAPDAVISKILFELRYEDVALVCKKWEELRRPTGLLLKDEWYSKCDKKFLEKMGKSCRALQLGRPALAADDKTKWLFVPSVLLSLNCFQYLQVLDVTGCILYGSDWPARVPTMPSLQCLSLKRAHHVEYQTAKFILAAAPNVTVLTLCGCHRLGENGPLAWAHLTRLTYLDVAGTRADDPQFAKSISGLTRLRNLNVSMLPKLGERSAIAISKLSELRCLKLVNSTLSATCLSHFSKLNKLRHLDLSLNAQIQARAIHDLFVKLPRIQLLDLEYRKAFNSGFISNLLQYHPLNSPQARSPSQTGANHWGFHDEETDDEPLQVPRVEIDISQRLMCECDAAVVRKHVCIPSIWKAF